MINLKEKFKKAFGAMNAGNCNKVVYSSDSRNEKLEDYISDNLELLQEVFSDSGLEFTYLPEWMDFEDGEYDVNPSSDIVNEDEVRYSLYTDDILFESPYTDTELAQKHDVRFREADFLDRKYQQLRKQIPDWVLEQLFNEALQQREKLSRMIVRSQNKLVLVDYDNIEIELRPLEMAFYLLYLKHPNGINFKDLVDHKDELWRYYKHATITDDLDKMKLGLERLIDPFSGSANEHRSRIARAINEATGGKFSPELARYYKIEGAKGEDKKILLPQDKIDFNLDW